MRIALHVFTVLALGASATSVHALEPGGFVVAADDLVSELVAKLRNPKLTVEERRATEDGLLALGESGARALQRFVEERFHRTDERARKTEKSFLTAFERAARKTIEARLDRATQAEVEELRKQVNALRADADLTKERIHAEGDPAREKLERLLFVETGAVLERDAELGPARESLSADFYALEDDYGLWVRCNLALPAAKRSKALADPAGRWPSLDQAETWARLLATPMADADREVLTKNRELGAALPEPEEAAGVLDLNRLRIALGLRALLIDPKLCAAARDHSNDMRTLGFFAHESPVEGKKTPWDRAARFGTTAGGENISAGQDTGKDANLGWWYSPGHHKNMLGNSSRIGLGRSERLWTQMFG